MFIMVVRVGGVVVWWLVRLIVVIVSENMNLFYFCFEKIGGIIFVVKFSLKVFWIKFWSKIKVVKEDDDGYKKIFDLVVEVVFVLEIKDVLFKELWRMKCLKRFFSWDLEV